MAWLRNAKDRVGSDVAVDIEEWVGGEDVVVAHAVLRTELRTSRCGR